MLRKDAKVELLKGVPLFAECSKKELAAIAAVADEIDVPAGRELVREGSNARDFCVIVEGSADVTAGGKTINTLGAGDFFGEIALIRGGTRTATVATTSPTRLLELTDRAFARLIRELPSIETTVVAAADERLEPRAG